MKNLRFTHRRMGSVVLLALSISIASCGYSGKSDDSKDVAEQQNKEKFDNSREKEDAQFLVDAAEINLKQVQLGKLAEQNGSAAHVRELGKTMADVHTEAQGNLAVLAQSKNITIPTSPTDHAQDAYRKLNKESGRDFDKAYADLMVSGHKDAIKAFEKASTDCNDTDIKNWASGSLPDLRKHLNHSIDCQRKADQI